MPVRIYLFVLLLIMGNTNLISQPIQVMTFNIRYSTPKDGLNSWDNRKDFVANLLNYYEPDFFGVQEALHEQMVYLDQALPSYSYIGVGRDDGVQKGEYSGVFYRKDLYESIESGTFWLSKSPEKPSVGWDAAMERICSFVLLERKQDHKRFWVFNTHFDHIGVQARVASAKLILKQIKKKNKQDYPVFLTGDFNLVPEEEPIAVVKEVFADSKEASLTKPYGPTGTFNGFEFDKPLERRIDYIFVSGQNIVVDKYRVIDDFRDFRYPSDHMPVMATCHLK